MTTFCLYVVHFNSQLILINKPWKLWKLSPLGWRCLKKTNPKQNIKAVKLNFPILPSEF